MGMAQHVFRIAQRVLGRSSLPNALYHVLGSKNTGAERHRRSPSPKILRFVIVHRYITFCSAELSAIEGGRAVRYARVRGQSDILFVFLFGASCETGRIAKKKPKFRKTVVFHFEIGFKVTDHPGATHLWEARKSRYSTQTIGKSWRRGPGSNRRIKVLQFSGPRLSRCENRVLPLGEVPQKRLITMRALLRKDQEVVTVKRRAIGTSIIGFCDVWPERIVIGIAHR